MLELDYPRLRRVVEGAKLPTLFVTVSGAHLYGFPSPDSDVDLRGCHQLPLRRAVGLDPPDETIDRAFRDGEVEIDLVSHEVRKYFGLLVKNNGYVLEQIFSPLVVQGEEFLARLRPIARQCVTRFHYHHYRGFYATQRKLLEKQEPKTAKALLYAYRVLMTGIHLLNTGEVEANILLLNEGLRLPFIDDLIAQKVAEKAAPPALDWELHQRELAMLEQLLDAAFERSSLPEARDRSAVEEFLIELRLGKYKGD
jgi:predicted nucleotidyltransferase